MRSEGTFIANQGSLDAYGQLGVKKYRFVARPDTRTSPQCRDLNGKVFNVSDAMAGENLPPLHPYCRSTTAAVFDKIDKKGEKEYNKNESKFGPPMPKEQLNRIIKRLKEKGITVDMSDEIDEHLKNNNSKGAKYNYIQFGC